MHDNIFKFVIQMTNYNNCIHFHFFTRGWFFFQKNEKKWIFFKNATTNHILTNNAFFHKNTSTDQILMSWKFGNPMLWLIDFSKNPKNWCFFMSLSWDFTFVKCQKKAPLIIIILINWAKIDVFDPKFSQKINFLKKKWQIFIL